jgi:hypothetical protein
MKNQKKIQHYPKYVAMGDPKGTALQREGKDEEGNVLYYRIAGDWDVATKIVNGELLVNEKEDSKMYHANNMKLVEILRDVWGKDNAGYTGCKKYDKGYHF